MLTSFALIFLVGFSLAAICQKIRLPRIIGMLITGIVLGPFVLNFLDATILNISAELRQMALVIILIKAGLSLNFADLKKVGRPAILLAFLPATLEITAFIMFAPLVFHITRLEAAVMGAVLSAVSPAVVIPRMVNLMEEKRGTNKQIPQMILAGASLDDAFVIVLFTAFVSIAEGNSGSVLTLIDIPVSIILGILLGVATGYALNWFFETTYANAHLIRNSMKVIIVVGTAFLLVAVEDRLEGMVAVSGLLAVMSSALVLGNRSVTTVRERLVEKFGKLWIAAEVVLFVLVGAAVDIRYTLSAGLGAIFLIFTGLLCRSIGVFLCLIATKLNIRERFFCVIAYLPKATVQAAIGSIPLALGLSCGKLVLSVAVLAILITAPLGAMGMDVASKSLLYQSSQAIN